jgi:hypothetical protein
VPYYEGFEAGTGDFLSSGNSNSWEYGAPSGIVITSAAQGTKAWVTNLNGVYNNNEESSLLTPYFDNSAGTFDLVYEFDMALATENNFDETWVEYSFNDSVWTKLTAGTSSKNWYNDTQNQWWQGDNDPSWTNRRAVVPNSAGQIVHFRHRFSSDGSVAREGVGIDELNVYEIPCEFPVTDLSSSNVTASSFDLHWTSNASSWEIETGPVGYGQATGVGVITNVSNDTATITIGACDSVDVYVRAVCGATYSPWVGPIAVGVLCEYDLRLNDLLVDMNTCGDSATAVEAVVENRGLYDATNFPVNADISGGITAALSTTYTGTLLSGEVDTILVGTFNSSAGATNVDIVGYTSLTGDQYTSNDSISYKDAGYIGLAPQVAANDTICTTDAYGVLYAEPIDGLTYGWYASPTDSVATAVGDSFVVANPGQLNWYLGYEVPSTSLEANLLPNNGLSANGSGVAFSIKPTKNTPITGFDLTTYAAVGTSLTVWVSYLANTTLTATNWNSANWVYVDTVTVTYTGNLTNVVLNKPLNIPGGGTSSLRIQTSSGIRYVTGSLFGTVWAINNELTIYQGLSFGSLTGGTNNPRNFSGRIYYGAGGKCSDSLTPVSVEYYQDTAQADFTFSMGADGRTVYFDATNSVGNVYSWDFGDGTTGMGDTISHTFGDSVGVYAVCLFVDDTVCMTSDYYCDGLVTTVGLEESNLASNVKLYPNPSQGNFNVSFTTAVESDYQIEIVDITGRTVNKKTGETKYGENQVRFDADLPDGVYMVKVIVEGDVSTSRLVIRS